MDFSKKENFVGESYMTQHEKNWAYIHKLHLLTSYHFTTPYVQTTLFYFQLLAVHVTKISTLLWQKC